MSLTRDSRGHELDRRIWMLGDHPGGIRGLCAAHPFRVVHRRMESSERHAAAAFPGCMGSEFAKYQQTPEYQQINRGLSLTEYREIFLVEWFHRILARVAGLVFAVPFFVFVFTRRIPRRESPVYVVMGVLFLSQAAMGWIMVSSGLVDRLPSATLRWQDIYSWPFP